MSNPATDRSGDAARERAAEDRRDNLRNTGRTTCPHGEEDRSACAKCIEERKEREARNASRISELAAESAAKDAAIYDSGIPLAESGVISVELPNDNGEFEDVPVEMVLNRFPGARLVAPYGEHKGDRKVMTSRTSSTCWECKRRRRK